MEHSRKMTRYAFMSRMEAYMKELLKHPGTGHVDNFLRDNGIDEKRAVNLLLQPTIEGDPNSAILVRKERIKKSDDGKDVFSICYKLQKDNYLKKMRNLYISLFESNIADGSPIDECCDAGVSAGATSADASGQFIAPINSKPIKQKTVYMTQEQVDDLKKKLLSEDGSFFGNFSYDASALDGRTDPAYDHKNIIKGGIQK